jgi:hypothetical protein
MSFFQRLAVVAAVVGALVLAARAIGAYADAHAFEIAVLIVGALM